MLLHVIKDEGVCDLQQRMFEANKEPKGFTVIATL